MAAIPSVIKPFLWSYNTDKMDIKRDKDRIVINVLKLGTPEATQWVQDNYSRDEILEALQGVTAKELDPKSRNYWSLMFNIDIPSGKRVIPNT